MEALYELCKWVIQIAGPLMLAAVVIMYASVALRTGRPPRPDQALYLYVKYNLENRRHLGIMTYTLIACSIFFLAALAGIVYSRLAG